MAPIDCEWRPVRLVHVPAMWPRSPRQVRASSQCEIMRQRSCHARGIGRSEARPPPLELGLSGTSCARDMREHVPILHTAERVAEVLDGARSGLTSFAARPPLRLCEQRAKLLDELGRGRAPAVECLDPLEALEHGSRFVHLSTVEPTRSRPGNGFATSLRQGDWRNGLRAAEGAPDRRDAQRPRSPRYLEYRGFLRPRLAPTGGTSTTRRVPPSPPRRRSRAERHGVRARAARGRARARAGRGRESGARPRPRDGRRRPQPSSTAPRWRAH